MGYAVPAKVIVFAVKIRYCSIQTDNCFLKVASDYISTVVVTKVKVYSHLKLVVGLNITVYVGYFL